MVVTFQLEPHEVQEALDGLNGLLWRLATLEAKLDDAKSGYCSEK